MNRSTRVRCVRFAALAATVLVLGVTAESSGAPPTTDVVATRAARHDAHRVVVDGTGGGILSLSGFEGDRVSFRLSASAPADRPVDVAGSFAVTHVAADGRVLADFAGTVDCLLAGGGVAVATGVITSGSAPGLPDNPDLIGHRIGLSVADDGRRDHLGWSWLVHQFHDVLPCTGIAPFFPVTVGDFEVRGPDSYGGAHG